MFSSSSSPYLNWTNPSSSSLNEDLLSLYYSNVAPTFDASSNSKNIKNPETANVSDHCRAAAATAKKAKKADRHSKIYTAQGPRDRRVRLSIDISKKFFGLQDLLGFDKASLTLDWLLAKSKTAIGELCRAKNIDISKHTCLCSLSEFGQEEAEADDNSVVGSKETDTSSKRTGKSARSRNRKPEMSCKDIAAKESREKARERARERTRIKNSLRHIILGDSPTTNNYPWPGQIGSSKSTDSSRQSTLTSSNEHSATPTTDPVEGFFFVNPRTGEVNINHHHHQEDAFSESATFRTNNKLDFNLWRSSMNHDDLF